MVGSAEEELAEEVKKLRADLAKTKEELKSAKRESSEKGREKKSLSEVTCYGCGEKGHIRRNCPHENSRSQGNGSRRLEKH